MKIQLPRIFDGLAVLAIVAAAVAGIAGAAGQPTAVAITETSAVRVEIQRYMGYEILPVRYLSLPYDLTMNVNEQLGLLDVGFLLLAFVPVLMILGLKRWPALQWTVVVSCLFLLVISTANGYISGLNLEMMKTDQASLANYLASTSFADAPAGVISAFFYQFFLNIYGGIAVILSRISGDADAVTYPIMLVFFALFYYCMVRRMGGRPLREQGIFVMIFVYSFFWLILSSGIVWYGFLVFPVLTALVFWEMSKQAQHQALTEKVVLYGFFVLTGISVLIGFTQRVSNVKIDIVKVDPLVGKRMYDPACVRFQAGDIDEDGVTDSFYAGLTKAIKEINQETNSLIYNVSTRFSFFIRENDKRIFKDNQLDFFNQVQTKYPNKERITSMLKNAGFRYIMVDFNTPTGDKTPEQVLVKRYKNLLLLFYNNPAVELVATNRVLKETVGGKEQYKYGVFGDMKEFGSYAIYRIK